MNYKIAQFILTPGQRSQSTLEIYVAQPDAAKEALAGKLFALIEIESIKAENLKIINFLINTLNHNYYQSEKMILRERLNTITVEHIFESALAKTNKKLAEFLPSEKIRLNFNILNITVGVIYNDSLHFANLGKNKAMLIYKGKADDGVKYKLADITGQTNPGETKKQVSPLKLFSNVVSGSLPRGGYFIFTGETLSEYLSAKQIISIITTLPPSSAAEQIKNTLAKINAYVPFLGIIIKNTAGLETSEKIKEPIAKTSASINHLIATEEKTEKLLTPSGLINLKKWSSFFNNLPGRQLFRPTDKSGGGAFLLKDKIFAKRKSFWPSLIKLTALLKNGFVYLASALIYLFKIITDKRALADFIRQAAVKLKTFYRAAKTAAVSGFFWFKRLNRVNKILFAAFLICLLLFSANLVRQSFKNKTLAREASLNNLLSLIEQKQNQIDASLLYNNETGAQSLFDEVGELLKQLPQKNQSQIDRYNALAAKNQVHLEKISRVIRPTPLELANFSNLNAAARPNNIVLAKGKIYAADAAQSAVYTIDLASKLITTIGLNSQNIVSLNFPSLDKDNNIYYLNGNNLSVLDGKTEKLSSLSIDYPKDIAKVIDLKQYNNRFYLADAQSGQIFRLAKTADKLTNAAAWLNASIDLAGLAGLDIDGSIYLLKNNGEILKFTKGQKDDFIPDGVEPKFSQATKISAAAEQNYIYVLESAAKRLVVFDKNGKFICQYSADKFADLKDFQVDEKNKKIYFLAGTIVYSADASHLNK